MARYGFAAARQYDLETVIRQVAPTILIGTTGRAGTFPEGAIRAMAAATPVPVIFPLSNPTSHTEAAPGGPAGLDRRPRAGRHRQPVRPGPGG